MLYSGNTLKLSKNNNILELCFDNTSSNVNVLNREALVELGEAVALLAAEKDADGLVLTSAKDAFIVGADITEFLSYFQEPDEVLAEMLVRVNGMFNQIEDLPYPTVTAIKSDAQGGGFEISLATDFRVAAPDARVALPEVKLGIMPGWGGSIRLPRLIGIDNALEWMCTGSVKRAPAALTEGAVDAVVPTDKLLDAAHSIIKQVKEGKLDYKKRRAQKINPLGLSPMELGMAYESAKGVIGGKAGPHYPSPLTIVETVKNHAGLSRNEALPMESENFVMLAKTDVAESLVGIFLKDQGLKRGAKKLMANATKVEQTAVLGAGIMGGGIAYQSASNGVPIVMKDIRQEALDDGLEEVGKLLKKQLKRGRLKPEGMAGVLNAIQPALSYGEFNDVDLVVEAVVENPKIKQSVLAELEKNVSEDTIITTNTSTISVNLLSESLKRPENFCGMHFFNPVHLMPLVEVIRAESSSEKAIATTVAYALSLKKTPIVVNDCPGFLVNRILFAYFSGFDKLIADGGNHKQIDKVMEGYGWPMGPAYLLDVVGLDTGKHAAAVMAEGFPDRMSSGDGSVIDAMFNANRLGQKNGVGFYKYEMDKRGKPKKLPDADGDAVVHSVQSSQQEFDNSDIIMRLMIPMCIETARCVEDNIVSSPAEADMGLVYGVGFPAFRGGALHHVDKIGLAKFCEFADKFKDLGPLYHPTDKMREMAKTGATFYPSNATTGEKS
jgi:3-hydroxyacyl-CoA dehydrogenase/enoyl-CoA hydratase/3-hydroxybutyryl-CoA epimerase/enoyl-CoA isomerase